MTTTNNIAITLCAEVPDGANLRPQVTVVVPIYERPHCVGPLLETLRAQTLEDWELVLVDDGSIADIAGALAPYRGDPRVHYIRLTPNRGVSAARNVGIAAALGDYVAFLDSDDRWHPEKLARQVAAIKAASDPKNCFCVTLTVVEMPGGWTRIRPDFDPRPGQTFADYLYVDGGFAQASSLMVPRELAAHVPFREQLRQYEDHLYFIELAATGADYLVVREPLSTWVNDDRGDRLGASDDLARGEALFAAAGALMPEPTRLAFRLRALGGPLFQRSPFNTLLLAARAVLTAAMPPRHVAILAARWVVPPALWSRLRRGAG